MAYNLTENVIQAYETILEQSKLEAYFRHHLAPNSTEEEGESSETGSSNTEDEGEDPNELADGTSWSNIELNLFFISLERRSRLRCDLIAEDMGGCKSISQIAHLIYLFEQQKHEQKAERNGLRRIENTPIAIEVSKEWSEVEQAIASHLQAWEETKLQKFNITAESECDWDTQVLHSILFLRHSYHLDPKKNAPNLIIEQSSSSTEENKIFSFATSDVVEMLHDTRLAKKIDSLAFRTFAKDHCVPIIDSLNSDQKAWEIILRSIQLGFFVPINARRGKKKTHGQFRASLDKQIDVVSGLTLESLQESPEQRLIWWDSLPNNDNFETLTRRLDDTRESALHQLLRSLRKRELKRIMSMIYVKTADKESEKGAGTKHLLTEDDNDESSPSKRRKIITGERSVTADGDAWAKRMLRFDRIGIDKDALISFLEHHFNFEDQSLFNAKFVDHILKRIKSEHSPQLVEKLSLHIFDLFVVCLRWFLRRIFEHITDKISHSLRPELKNVAVEITKEDILKVVELVCPEIIEDKDSDDEPGENTNSESNGNPDEGLSSLDVFDRGLSDWMHDDMPLAYVQGLLNPSDKEEKDAYERICNHVSGLKGVPTPQECAKSSKEFDRTETEKETAEGEKKKEEKEIAEIIRWDGVDEKDMKQSQLGEEILWSRLNLNIPEALSYEGQKEDETSDRSGSVSEDEEEGESESESSSSTSD